MILAPFVTAHAVPEYGHFDYVTVDARRARVYAAHTSSRRLLIVDAKTGAVLRQIEVGPVHGLAVDELSGDVFTGNGTDDSVSRVDPLSGTVTGTTAVPGPVDAIAYDPSRKRIYADEDSGNRIFVIDANRMKLVATITTPGHDLEYLAVDPGTHQLYQNLPGLAEFVVIDPDTLRIVRTVRTPELRNDHPLMFDAKARTVIVGGKNGVISVYSTSGKKLSQASMPGDVDQCDFNQVLGMVGCAGNGRIWVLRLGADNSLHLIGSQAIQKEVHTLGWDTATGMLWTVWALPADTRVAGFRTNLTVVRR